MDKDYFMNAGIPPPQLHFDAIPWSGLNCTAAEQPFMDTNSAVDQFSHFESALSSMVTSPASAAPSNEAFLLRELIGKLNGAGTSAAYAAATNNNDSCYSTPLSSPKLHLPILDQINLSPNLGNSVALTPPLPSLSADPGFAERAAKFSCFGSRSFNGRTAPLSLNISESPHRSKSPLMNAKLPRVSSSPSLKQQAGSSPENKNFTEIRASEKKLSKFSGSAANSNEESSVSDQIPSGETGSGSKISNELNSRKRKAVSKSKPKENGSAKGVDGDDDGNAKRSKLTGNGKIENVDNKSDEEAKGGGSNDESEKQKANQKPPEPPKDYIHVRARRGQATDSHSLAERVRREKISERMKLLQDLVPGCNKVTGKALMLDEIINYVQSLQRQVEFLSMKLASVNPELDFNMDNLHSKDTFQQNATIPQQLYPMDSSAPFYQQNVQPPMHNNTDVSGSLPLGIQLSSVDGFAENFPQFPGFTEDDLHSIVGFVHNPVNFPGPNQTSNMKVER